MIATEDANVQGKPHRAPVLGRELQEIEEC